MWLSLALVFAICQQMYGGPVDLENKLMRQLNKLSEDVQEILNEDNLFLKQRDESKRDYSSTDLDTIKAEYETLNTDTFEDCTDATDPDSFNCDEASSQTHSVDGRCNNLANRARGAVHSRVRRIISTASYVTSDMPIGYPLPKNTNMIKSKPGRTKVKYSQVLSDNNIIRTAQEISDLVFESITTDKKDSNALASHMFMTFGQFIDHDVALIEPTPGLCANPTCFRYDDFEYPCFSIPKNKGTDDDCRSFTRSRADCASKGSQREQINDLSAFLDASNVYGSTTTRFAELRGENGLMKTSANDLLPFDTTSTEPCTSTGGCFLAGDFRVNENAALTSMHTIWIRLHNYIVGKLPSAWTSDEKFYTARKINIAFFQKIVVYEWLNLVTDIPAYTAYDENADSTLSNVFQTAAFRFGHSLIRDEFELLDKDFEEIASPVSLQAAFFNTGPILDTKPASSEIFGIEPTCMGLLGNTSNKVDTEIATGVIDKLFIPVGNSLTQNLVARNIQRGRDHGLASYQEYKEELGQTFSESNPTEFFEQSVYDSIKEAYKDENNNLGFVDVFVGGIAEKPVPGKVVGKLFGKIIGDQFDLFRKGDRFWFEKSGVFTADGLAEINKMTMAHVLCFTLNELVSIQDEAFRAFDPATGTRKECTNKVAIDFTKFAKVTV